MFIKFNLNRNIVYYKINALGLRVAWEFFALSLFGIILKPKMSINKILQALGYRHR